MLTPSTTQPGHGADHRQPCPASFAYLLAFMGIAYGPRQAQAPGLRAQLDELLSRASCAGFAHVDLITTLIANGERDSPRVLQLATLLGEVIGDAAIIKFITDFSTNVKAYNMSILNTSTTMAAAHPDPMFAAIPADLSQLAKQLGMEIIVFVDDYGLAQDGEVVLDSVTLNDIDHYLTGYLNGKDDIDGSALIDELVKADQIILTMIAHMSDEHKLKVAKSLQLGGFPLTGAARCAERQILIADTRDGILRGAL